MVSFSKGILVGGTKGTISVFERNAEDLKSSYHQSSRVITVPDSE
jgi:hypothetical protein